MHGCSNCSRRARELTAPGDFNHLTCPQANKRSVAPAGDKTSEYMTKKLKWTCGLRVWLEHEGQVVLGRGRVELLEAIDLHRSIPR